jgi:hypothetical protein
MHGMLAFPTELIRLYETQLAPYGVLAQGARTADFDPQTQFGKLFSAKSFIGNADVSKTSGSNVNAKRNSHPTLQRR